MARLDQRHRASGIIVVAASLAAACAAQSQIGGVAGAALVEKPARAILAWGEGVAAWPLGGGSPTRYLQTGRYGAGCADRDGTLYLLEGRRLIASSPPYSKTMLLEPDTEFQDCLPWTMNGRRGVLIPHRHLQLRFYSRTEPPVDLYSIYTPSKQGGLMEADIDGDGRQDLLWGNYWLRRPDEPGTHWRLFAANTYFEQPDSALARLALDPRGRLYWGASTGPPRLVFMTPGTDPTQLWNAEPLPDPPPELRSLLAVKDGLIAAHASGIHIYTRLATGWTKRIRSAQPATALIQAGKEVWAVFDDGPSVIYRLK